MVSVKLIAFFFCFIVFCGITGNNGVNGHIIENAVNGMKEALSAAHGGITGALTQAKKGVEQGDITYRAGRFFNELGKGAMNVVDAGLGFITNTLG